MPSQPLTSLRLLLAPEIRARARPLAGGANPQGPAPGSTTVRVGGRLGSPTKGIFAFSPSPVFAPKVGRAYAISGVTRDSAGNPIGGCIVKMFRTIDDAFVSRTVSDVNGAFSLGVQPFTEFYLVAYSGVTLFGVTNEAIDNGSNHLYLPLGVKDNDILVLIAFGPASSLTFPAGWTTVVDLTEPLNGASSLVVAWKRAASGESDPAIVGGLLRVLILRGCVAAGSPIDVISTGTDPTDSAVVPSLTPTVAGDGIVLAAAGSIGQLVKSFFSAEVGSGPVMMTQFSDVQIGATEATSIVGAFGRKGDVAATGARHLSVIPIGSNGIAAAMVAFKGAGVPVAGVTLDTLAGS